MLVSCVSAVTYHRRIAIAGVYIATAVVVHRVPALAYLPKLVLASVVIIAVIQLIELRHLLRFWTVQRRLD